MAVSAVARQFWMRQRDKQDDNPWPRRLRLVSVLSRAGFVAVDCRGGQSGCVVVAGVVILRGVGLILWPFVPPSSGIAFDIHLESIVAWWTGGRRRQRPGRVGEDRIHAPKGWLAVISMDAVVSALGIQFEQHAGLGLILVT